MDNDEIVLRNLDGFGRTLANAYRQYNLGGDDYRKRIFMDRKYNNYNTAAAAQHRLSPQKQLLSSTQAKDQQQQQQSTLLNSQHELKRAIDPIGGANLLKRAVDRIGGGHLL